MPLWQETSCTNQAVGIFPRMWLWETRTGACRASDGTWPQTAALFRFSGLMSINVNITSLERSDLTFTNYSLSLFLKEVAIKAAFVRIFNFP